MSAKTATEALAERISGYDGQNRGQPTLEDNRKAEMLAEGTGPEPVRGLRFSQHTL